MYKLRKILVLMLILVVMVASFTIVAFAAEDDGATVEKKVGVLSCYNFESGEEGSLSFQANDDGKGYFGVAVAENGNKFIKHYFKSGVGNDGYLSGPYMANKTYSFAEYPYLAIDIDISKLTAEYTECTIQAIDYAYGPVYDDLGNLVKTLNGSAGDTTVSLPMSTFKKYLPTEKNVWAHVTVVYKYHIFDGGEYIGAYAYVNGQKVYSDDTFKAVSETYLASNYYYGTFRVGNSGSVDNSATKQTGYDNWQMTFFNEGYTLDEVASYVYNDSYELPYGVTVAQVGNNVYDNLNKAIQAAQPGQVVTLLNDVKQTISVEKVVQIDTNKYDENGEPTGEYYNLSTTSSTLVSSAENGVLSFKQLQNASVEVYWDDCPGKTAGGECTCDPLYLDENGNHRMYEFDASAMLNSVPSYNGVIPEFPIVNGVSTQFIGWSYTPGGEVEPLRPVTEDDVKEGWIPLYPVYETLQYSLEVINSDGSTAGYYLASEADAAFSGAKANATIKLHTDVKLSAYITLTKKNLTLDLNGHSFGAVRTTVTDYAATYDEATGEYIKGEKIADPVTEGKETYVFYTAANGYVFNITSSVPGGVISSLSVSYDRWICDGVPVKTDNAALTSKGGAALFNLYPSSATFNIKAPKGYLTIYTGGLFYGEHGSCDKNLRTTIEGATIYFVGSYGEGGNAIRGGGEHYFRDCVMVADSSSK